MRGHASLNRSDTVLCKLFDRMSGNPDRWIEWRTLVDDIVEGRRCAPRQMPPEWRMLLTRLKKKKLIENQKRGKQILIRLSDKGKFRAQVKAIASQKDSYPVGEGCMVVYDIPESERGSRDVLRRFLKECGFRFLQKSVLVSRKDVAPLVVKFVRQNKLTPWAQVIEGRVRA